MCLRKLLYSLMFIALFPAIFGVINPNAATTTKYVYLQTSGKKVDTATRIVIISDSFITLQYTDTKQNQSESVCNTAYEVVSWHFCNKKQGTDVIIRREGLRLTISGIVKKRPVKRTTTLDTLPWYQTLELSLAPFAKSNNSATSFWILRPTDFSVYKMVARKKKDQHRDPSTFSDTIKLSITPAGISDRIWCATLQLSKNTGGFFGSSMPSFIPGKPPLMVSLLAIVQED